MTPTLLRHDAAAPTATNRPRQQGHQAEAVLRDLAYVLHLTRKVREEIVEEREAEATVAV